MEQSENRSAPTLFSSERSQLVGVYLTGTGPEAANVTLRGPYVLLRSSPTTDSIVTVAVDEKETESSLVLRVVES